MTTDYCNVWFKIVSYEGTCLDSWAGAVGDNSAAY